MSAALHYTTEGGEPVPVGYPAKYELARPFCDTDGTIGDPFTVTKDDLPTLRPLLAALREKVASADDKDKAYFAKSATDMEAIIAHAEAGHTMQFWFEH